MADAKQGKSSIEDFYNGSSQSRVVLAKPRLGSFGMSSFPSSSSSKSCNPFGSVLRPSTLKPGSNPFLKVTENSEEKEDKKEEENESRLKDTKEEEEPPKFVPLGSANVTPRTSNPVPAPPSQPTASSSSGFVFGQNLSERVVIQENVNNGEAEATVDHSSTNGTSDLLFTSAAASVKENAQEEASSGSLAAAAAEYERSHARPPPPAAQYNITGEEGEVNVLQISCRLFAWESGSWRERGRGVLRLNDAAPSASGGTGTGATGTTSSGGAAARLVVRVAGSLRVALNTPLWPDMVVQRAGTKSLRITAADHNNTVKLYLIMGAPADIVQLYRALTARVALSKKSSSCSQNATSQKAAERLEADTDENEFLDKNESSDKPDNDASDETKEEASIQEQKTEEDQTPTEQKPLKRKEPADEETSTKRQCPEVLKE